MTYLEKGIFLLPEDKKILPVSFDQFSEGDLAKVDELLENIIRYYHTARSHSFICYFPLYFLIMVSSISLDNVQKKEV